MKSYRILLFLIGLACFIQTTEAQNFINEDDIKDQ